MLLLDCYNVVIYICNDSFKAINLHLGLAPISPAAASRFTVSVSVSDQQPFSPLDINIKTVMQVIRIKNLIKEVSITNFSHSAS